METHAILPHQSRRLSRSQRARNWGSAWDAWPPTCLCTPLWSPYRPVCHPWGYPPSCASHRGHFPASQSSTHQRGHSSLATVQCKASWTSLLCCVYWRYCSCCCMKPFHKNSQNLSDVRTVYTTKYLIGATAAHTHSRKPAAQQMRPCCTCKCLLRCVCVCVCECILPGVAEVSRRQETGSEAWPLAPVVQ